MNYLIPVNLVKNIYEKAGLDFLKPNYFKFLTELSRPSLEAWVQNFWYADGVKELPYPQSFCQTQATDPEKVDMLSLASHLLGYTPRIRKHFVNFGTPNTTIRKLEHKSLGVQKVACLETETSNFVIRQNGFITLTGNCKFDLKVIKSTFGVWLPNVDCTMILMQRLGLCTGYKAAQARGFSLKALARDYFDIVLSKVEQDSDWSTPILRNSQLEYAALDVGKPKDSNLKHSILLDGYFLLKEALETEPPNGYGVAESLEIDQRCNEVLARCEYTGMPVSLDMLNAIYNQARVELEESKLYLCKELDIKVEQRLNFDDEGNPYKEIIISDKTIALLNNPKNLVQLVNKKLASAGEKLTDAQSGTLEALLKKLKVEKEEAEKEMSEDEELDNSYFIEEVEFNSILIDNLLKYKKLVKLVSIDYRNIINVVTGCIHPEFSCIGASTGRMASRGLFNAQQISTVFLVISALENPFISDSLIV
ncbi:MAG: hypothetical protein MUF43_04095 [Flavobacterium sp.]|nr:hypothetical protein [Flavobacterium sp.]